MSNSGLNRDRIVELKNRGITHHFHLQSSREFYPRVASTHSYETRLKTLRAFLEGGLGLCSGGADGLIIGGYLTPSGNPVETDLEMFHSAGFKVPAERKSAVLN